MARVVIFGATSAIAQAVARIWASRGCAMVLAGRDGNRLEAIGRDLRARGAERVTTHVLDALDTPRHEEFVDRAFEYLELPDFVLIAHGTLPDHARARRDPQAVADALAVNGASACALAAAFAARLEPARHGTVAVISSVAGDRGRASNYVYGAAKGTVDRFLEGLSASLRDTGVRIVNVKPGFVDTPMTAGFSKNALFATPEGIAPAIVDAIERGARVAYVPWFWGPIMAVLRAVPRFVFERLPI